MIIRYNKEKEPGIAGHQLHPDASEPGLPERKARNGSSPGFTGQEL